MEQNIIEQKKAAVDLTELAIGIVIIGISISIGAVILNGIGSSQITNAATYQVVNETTGAISETQVVNLAQRWVKSIDTVYNRTGTATTIPTTNYTTSISAEGTGTVSGNTAFYGSSFNGSTTKVTYTVYNVTDPRYLIPNKAELGLAEYGNWFKILVIVGVAAVVLGLIFMAFGRKGAEGGTAY